MLTNAGGRLQIVYDLDLDKAVDDRASSIRHDLEEGLADRKIIATVGMSARSPGEIRVTPVCCGAQLHRVRKAATTPPGCEDRLAG